MLNCCAEFTIKVALSNKTSKIITASHVIEGRVQVFNSSCAFSQNTPVLPVSRPAGWAPGSAH